MVELLAGLLARRAQWLGAAIDTSPQAIAELTAALRDAADAAMRALVSASDALGRHGNIAELAAYCATVWDRPGSETKLLDQAEARRQLGALAVAADTRRAARIGKHWPRCCWPARAVSGRGASRRCGTKTAGFPKHDDKAFADLDPVRCGASARSKWWRCSKPCSTSTIWPEASTTLIICPHSLRWPNMRPLCATRWYCCATAIELVALMRERGVTDFSGIMTAALAALRDNRADVMANLDAKLRHVLVDEGARHQSCAV